MAFTRIHDEPCRIKKELQQMTDIGKYMITTPGPGANVGFAEDPHIRLQGWGANLRTNTINTESDLLGLTRPLTKDCRDINQYDKMKVSNERLSYGTIAPNTEERILSIVVILLVLRYRCLLSRRNSVSPPSASAIADSVIGKGLSGFTEPII